MNKVFEYMALGLPFAMYDLKQAASEAGEAALIVPGSGAEALAAGIAELADSPDRRRRMAEHGRAHASATFTWESQEPALLSAYETALAS
jgi:glycosyltransferase involved in cell wall biosynthesis